jgi:hypothetical protein
MNLSISVSVVIFESHFLLLQTHPMAANIEKPNHPGVFTMPEIKHAFNAFDLDDNKFVISALSCTVFRA